MRNPHWALVQYSDTAGAIRTGLLADGHVRQAPDWLPRTGLGVLDAWRELEPRLRSLDPAAQEVVDGARLVSPLTFPRKVICAGANYYDHAAEMGAAAPDPDAAPFYFLKTPTTTIVGPEDEIAFPLGDDARADWEIELTVVIADRCRDLSVEEALDHVAGYTVANDLSARGFFPRPEAVQAPFSFDWVAHKSQDASCPIGPGIVPSWLVPDPGALDLRLSVNDTVKQDSNTSQLVIGLAKLVAGASRLVTLEPGDLILTGTPAGVGAGKGEWLRDGDVVTAEIDGIGRISNRIVARH